MIKPTNGRIGFREITALIFIIITIKSADMTSANLFPLGESATWMFPIIWILVMIIPILALTSLCKAYRNKNLIEIIYHLTGKYLGLLISFLLFIIAFSALIFNSRAYVDIMKVEIFTTTPIVVVYGLLIGASYFIANRGLEAIGRTSFILLPIVIFGSALLIILIGDELIPEYLFPITGSGIVPVIKHGIQNSSLIGEFLLIAVFFPYASNFKDYKRANIIGFTLACLGISLIYALYVMLFDYIAPQKMFHVFSQTSSMTGVGMFINNFDAFYFGTWTFTGLIRFSFYLYSCAALFAYTVKIKEFEPLLLPIAVLTVALGRLPKNVAKVIFILRGNLLRSSWTIFFILPVILWLIAKKRGEIKK